MRSRLALLLSALLLAACRGAEGPMGPAGAAGTAGKQGVAGPSTRVVFTVKVGATGGASAVLPASVGTTFADPPALTCYSSGFLIPLQYTVIAFPNCQLVLSGTTYTAQASNQAAQTTVTFVAVY